MMEAIFVKQPNGRYCRFSSIVDCPTDVNLTEKEIRDILINEAAARVDERIENLKNHPEWGWKYEDVKRNTQFGNISKKEFDELCKIMESEVSESISADAHPTSPWHKTSEELPREGQLVLISNPAIQFAIFDTLFHPVLRMGRGFEAIDNTFFDKVEYWMPIPKLPKED